MTTTTLPAKEKGARTRWSAKREDVRRVEAHVANGTWGDLEYLQDCLSVRLVKRSDLRRAGLNDRALRLLGEPDALSPNPHNPSGAPMWLYRVDRVREFMASDAFHSWLDTLRARQAAEYRN